MPSEVYLMWHKYRWTFCHLASDAKIVLTEGISYAAVATGLVCSLERLVMCDTDSYLRILGDSCLWLYNCADAVLMNQLLIPLSI